MSGILLASGFGEAAASMADAVSSWSLTQWVPIILAVLAVMRQMGIAPQLTDTITKLIQAIFKIPPQSDFESTDSAAGIVDTIDTLAAELEESGQKELADELRVKALPLLIRRRLVR